MKKGIGRDNHGIITVFVVLIMVPVVVITGLMVDLARSKLFASQVAMASDSYGDAVLSEYDNLLKELYGLFSITQDEAALKALDDYAKYIDYSFHPNADDSGLSGSMFFDSADISFTRENIDSAALTNENVFMTQVADYMEFRVVQQVMDENGFLKDGIFDRLEQFENTEADNKAVKAVSDLGDSSNKTLKEIDKYHKYLVEIKAYEPYLAALENAVSEYSEVMEDICNSSEYADYVFYLEHKDEIDAAKAKKERVDAQSDDSENKEELTDEENDLADRYVDVEAYVASIESEINPKSEDAHETDSEPTDFENVAEKIDALEQSGNKIEDLIKEVKEKLQELEQKLESCSEDVKQGIEEDIKDMREISDMSGRFKEICDNEKTQNNKQNNTENKTNMQSMLVQLDNIKESIFKGERKPGDTNWNKSIGFQWWNIPEGKGTLYSDLEEMYEKGKNASDKKEDADKKKDEANKKREEAVEKLNSEEENTTARNIPNDVMKEMKSSSSTEKVPSFFDYYMSGFSFKAVGESATLLYDKFLLTEYDFGMFSSRVSGLSPKSEKTEVLEPKENSEYVDYSLNKVKMSKDINYLYGAEIEYLYGGHQKSKDNLAAARNTICGVRMTMNFISTYTIKEINSVISTIATSASSAVAATGIGALAAPLIKVAVSAALRMAVASLETVKDWERLKNREEVLLFKSELDDLECVDDILDMLGKGSVEELKGSSGKGVSTDRLKISMSYEDYLHVLLFLCKDESTLVSRTSDLITLNVNQSKNKGDVLSAPLDFKMSDTMTAIKTTCKAKLDMVVAPENFMNMFLGGNDTQKRIEAYDDGYIYYTMIRGY